MRNKELILEILKESKKSLTTFKIQEKLKEKFNRKLSIVKIRIYLNRLIDKQFIYKTSDSKLLGYRYMNPLLQLILKIKIEEPLTDDFFNIFKNRPTMTFLERFEDYMKPYLGTVIPDLEVLLFE